VIISAPRYFFFVHAARLKLLRIFLLAAHGETDPKKNKELEKALQEYSDVGPEYIQRALANVKVLPRV